MEAIANPGAKRRVWWEIALVLGLSLGRSAIYSIIQLIGMLTDSTPLGEQVTALNPSRSARPLLDLALQLYAILFALVPALLALYFLALRPGEPPLRESLGLDWGAHPRMGAPRRFGASRQIGRIGRDLAQGFGLFALVGIPGLVFFALSRSLGITVAVQASALNAQWWTIPVLVLSAFQNGALEEIIIVGYLYRRLQDISWNQTTTIDWRFWLFSSILRGSYHLYQGIGPFIGNFAMGLLFAWWFQSRFGRKRIIPLIIAHTLIDTIAFVGYQFAPAALLRLIGLS